MRSVKPGRGPSMMGGIIGIIMVCFGIGWTVIASSFSGIFAVFGVLWTLAAIVTTVYNFKNATSENRYSAYDITDGFEESDPLNDRYGAPRETFTRASDRGSKYCPYCGTPAKSDYVFCDSCGKKLPR